MKPEVKYKMKPEVKYKICKITDLLKDYVVLHERIKALYTMLEVHGYIHWYWLESNHTKKKNYWENYYGREPPRFPLQELPKAHPLSF